MTMEYMIPKFAQLVMLHAMNALIVVQVPEKAVKVDITYNCKWKEEYWNMSS